MRSIIPALVDSQHCKPQAEHLEHSKSRRKKNFLSSTLEPSITTSKGEPQRHWKAKGRDMVQGHIGIFSIFSPSRMSCPCGI